ncbi:MULTISPECIES: AEC family transporter [Fischerella]|uniref:Transporter n=1 Tax=Fischerella muscicola CCMEE 5323 TaxID=2019572 RepID=A0A2N6JXS3_FISMU|nr:MULTISPECIES: AEC family transporter [Fischerella]MBD2434121.1 AEC family transporter [Fischerella sp. FACHB-380]PLZ85350.1 transporter [Fischerella muscicola CCMEE 5323]
MANLLELYVKLVGLVLLGFFLGRKLPATVPTCLGHFLFWVGVPISIVAFLYQTDLSGQIWIAPAIAYLAIFLGAFLAWIGIKWQALFTKTSLQQPTQGSFLLAAMLGNTGYLGYPVTLAIVGTQYFAWALFYDLLGTTLGAYGLGVALAARFSGSVHDIRHILKAIIINPALWSFGFGLILRQVVIPTPVEFYLDKFAWTAVALSLLLIGMRLSKLNSWHSLPQAGISLGIKMLLVPLILGFTLPFFGLTGAPAQVIVLQMAMPPAFATLVLAETFNLDRDLAVTALAVGSIILLVTLPLWLWLFSVG